MEQRKVWCRYCEPQYSRRRKPVLAVGNPSNSSRVGILSVDPKGEVDFLVEAGKLKRLLRTGWVKAGVPHPESVADHSYRTALIAMLFADLGGLDGGKMIRMALLHDLAEAEVGDLTPTQKEANPIWKLNEKKAVEHLTGFLPPDLAMRYESIIEEYNKDASEEAHLVHSADKLEMLLQAVEYVSVVKDEERLMRLRHVHFEGGFEAALEKEIKSRVSAKNSEA